MPPQAKINWIDTAKRSSTFARVAHDPRAGTLTLEFKTKGMYRYGNVNTAEFMSFMASPSLGKRFNERFYGRPKEHPSEKLAPTSGH